MIDEIKKTFYRSDIDESIEFDTLERAEKFEATFKPFYDLLKIAKQEYDYIYTYSEDSSIDNVKIARDLFNKALPLLTEYVAKVEPDYCTPENVECHSKFCPDDVMWLSNAFTNFGFDDNVIGELFDEIYDIMKFRNFGIWIYKKE